MARGAPKQPQEKSCARVFERTPMIILDLRLCHLHLGVQDVHQLPLRLANDIIPIRGFLQGRSLLTRLSSARFPFFLVREGRIWRLGWPITGWNFRAVPKTLCCIAGSADLYRGLSL